MKKTVFMKYGDFGTEVSKFQKLLQAAGSKIKVNGQYTIGMVTAVKTFQKRNKLPVTGEIDAKTKAALESYGKPAKKSKK